MIKIKIFKCIQLLGALFLLFSCSYRGISSANALRTHILSQIHEPVIIADSVLLTDLGAQSDSLTDALPVFRRAFDLCRAKGGLKLIVPKGVYLVNGPLHLVSNLHIHFNEGARLKFSSDAHFYLPVVPTSWEGTFINNYSPLIYAYQQKNIIISGKGILDGNAAQGFGKWKQFQTPAQMLTREQNHTSIPVKNRIYGDKNFLRPQFVQFFDCRNILIQDIHITNSPFWCIHLLKSRNAIIRNISYNAKNINNDGIDPEYSRNILIENVDFDNGDDNIAIKAGRDNEGRKTALTSENILIRNCRFKGLHAVVIGSEMSAGVQNVLVENCSSQGYCKRGVYLKSNPDRGGFIRNIYIKNVLLDEVEDLFYITSFYHGEGSGYATDINRIFVDNLSCNKAINAGVVIQGFEDKKVKNVYIKNMDIKKAGIGVSINQAEKVILENVNIGGKVMEVPTFAQ